MRACADRCEPCLDARSKGVQESATVTSSCHGEDCVSLSPFDGAAGLGAAGGWVLALRGAARTA